MNKDIIILSKSDGEGIVEVWGIFLVSMLISGTVNLCLQVQTLFTYRTACMEQQQEFEWFLCTCRC